MVQNAALHSSLSDIVKAPSDVQFGEVLLSAELFNQLQDEGEMALIFDHYCIKGTSFFFMKNTGDTIGDFEGLIGPDSRFS